MNKPILPALAFSLMTLTVLTQAALAQFKVGDRVKIGSSNEYGTVIEMGAPLYGGGNMIKVHLDRFGDANPNVGVTYDPVRSNVTPGGAGAPPAGNGAQAPNNAAAPGHAGAAPQAGNYMNNALQAVKSLPKGSRVYIGSMKEWGTVLGIGRGGAANMLNVHLDRFGNSNASVDFDPIGSNLQAAGGPQTPADPNPGAGAQLANNGGAAPQNGAPAPNANPGPGTDIQVPDNAPPDAETFKNLIRANAPQPGWGDTITFDFQTFSVSGPTPYEAKYAGHLDQQTIMGGAGHVYQAYKVHTKFVKTYHYADKFADDKYNVLEGDYMMYKDYKGHWVPEQLPGMTIGTTQYIHKQ